MSDRRSFIEQQLQQQQQKRFIDLTISKHSFLLLLFDIIWCCLIYWPNTHDPIYFVLYMRIYCLSVSMIIIIIICFFLYCVSVCVCVSNCNTSLLLLLLLLLWMVWERERGRGRESKNKERKKKKLSQFFMKKKKLCSSDDDDRWSVIGDWWMFLKMYVLVILSNLS